MENDARLAAKAHAKLKSVEAELTVTEQEKAAQARKKAIIQAAIARSQIKKEEMAAAENAVSTRTARLTPPIKD